MRSVTDKKGGLLPAFSRQWKLGCEELLTLGLQEGQIIDVDRTLILDLVPH